MAVNGRNGLKIDMLVGQKLCVDDESRIVQDLYIVPRHSYSSTPQMCIVLKANSLCSLSSLTVGLAVSSIPSTLWP